MIIRIVACCFFIAVAYSQNSSKTVLDGVYSETQAARGQALYMANCSTCHGSNLEGVSAPELTGNRFLERWREGVLVDFHNFLKERMPPGRGEKAVRMPDHDYVDIITYILKVNGYPAGSSDFTMAHLETVMLVGKDGPKPVPDGAHIVTIGCLSQPREGVWTLSNATEPVRARTSTTSTDAQLKHASQKALGTLTFRLTDFEAIADFSPEAHAGHKMQAKGYLVRQPNAERINLSALEMLDGMCVP